MLRADTLPRARSNSTALAGVQPPALLPVTRWGTSKAAPACDSPLGTLAPPRRFARPCSTYPVAAPCRTLARTSQREQGGGAGSSPLPPDLPGVLAASAPPRRPTASTTSNDRPARRLHNGIGSSGFTLRTVSPHPSPRPGLPAHPTRDTPTRGESKAAPGGGGGGGKHAEAGWRVPRKGGPRGGGAIAWRMGVPTVTL